MEISISFVEYDAANSLRDLSTVGFTLVSSAKLGQTANRRTWTLDGTPEAFATFRTDLRLARDRFLRYSIAAAVSSIITSIDEALAGSTLATAEIPPVKVEPPRRASGFWASVRNFGAPKT